MQIELPGYKIISTLGKGGMATVYLAIQESFQREVALKVMSPELVADPSYGERFIREAQIVSRLVHPNIVTVYDVGIHNGYYFLSMEYIPGKDLIHKYLQLNLSESLRVVKEIARALDFAGKKGYVHRDVKPENIMLHDEDGRAVLMDFGIARPSDTNSGMTKTGTAIGTPHYMSPEQAKGLVIDSRADLYSLGVVLFLLITGHVPYDSDSAVVVGIMHISEDIPALPPHLQIFQPIIDKVLAKNPAQRYQTGAELIAALDAIPAQTLAEVAEAREREPTPTSKRNLKQKTEMQPEATPIAPTLIVPPKSASPKSKTQIIDTQSIAAQSKTAQSKTAQSKTAQPDSMVARSEDRVVGYNYDEPVKTKKTGLVVALGVIALLAGGGYYFQNDVKKYLPESVRAQLKLDDPAAKTASVTTPSEQATFIERIKILREKLNQDWSLAPELAGLYRSEITSTNPVDRQAAQTGLNELQTLYAGKIKTALQENNLDEAKKYAESAQGIFAETERMPTLNSALSALRDAAATGEHLQQAETYFSKDALVSPAGANALEIYRTVLNDNPDNKVAQQGIEKITLRLSELAAIQQKNNNIDQALELVKQGLDISSNNLLLLDQQQTLLQLKQKAKSPKASDKTATTQVVEKPALKEVSAPAKAVVASKAQRSIDNESAANAAAENNYVQQINQLMSEGKLAEASSALLVARERFPQSQALLSLSLDLERAAAESNPGVTRLLVSGNEMSSLNSQQDPSIAAERVIYIGFEYRNFKADTSVIQAILYDGSRSLQIAQVPVVVNGAKGTKFFRMEQPVTGFANGGYNIDLLFDQQPLISTKFSVKK